MFLKHAIEIASSPLLKKLSKTGQFLQMHVTLVFGKHLFFFCKIKIGDKLRIKEPYHTIYQWTLNNRLKMESSKRKLCNVLKNHYNAKEGQAYTCKATRHQPDQHPQMLRKKFFLRVELNPFLLEFF
jgi:hypothetical protein